MEFPYRFTCEFSNKREQYEPCRGLLQPLSLHLETDTNRRNFKLFDLRLQQTERGEKNTKVLLAGQEQLCFRFADHVDFRIFQSALRQLVPDGEFEDLWRKEEPLEVLSTDTCELFTVESKKKMGRMMIRKLRYSRPSTTTQLECIRLLSSRCVMKPENAYVDGGFVKLLYRPFNGTLLKRHLKKKRLPQEDELRQFVTKLLFFLTELEQRKLRLQSLRDDMVLLQGQKYSQPQVMDLSAVLPDDQQGGPNRHVWSLGVLLYKIVMMKPPQLSELSRIRRWLANDTPAFNQSQTIYNKSFFDMLLEMLSENGNRASIEKLLKHRWFLEKFDNSMKANRLATIKSINHGECEISEQEFSEGSDSQQTEVPVNPQHIVVQEDSQSDCLEADNEYDRNEPTLVHRMSQIELSRKKPFSFFSGIDETADEG